MLYRGNLDYLSESVDGYRMKPHGGESPAVHVRAHALEPVIVVVVAIVVVVVIVVVVEVVEDVHDGVDGDEEEGEEGERVETGLRGTAGRGS